MSNKLKKGFTLIELAIVLVIVGLLVGGVLQGQELIKQAQLRKIIRELGSVDLGFNTFRAKYDALPGDIRNPQRFFPECNEEFYSNNPGIVTQGNGDGIITDGGWGERERPCFWLHMANAGVYNPAPMPMGSMVPGNEFDPPYPPRNIDYTADSVVMAMLVGSPKMLMQVDTWVNAGTPFDNKVMLVINEAPPFPDGFLPEFIYDIDSKIDDGKPYGGKVRSDRSSTDQDICFTNAPFGSGNEFYPAPESEYILGVEGHEAICRMLYILM